MLSAFGIELTMLAAGAMENYGLVTYRETALLFDDLHSAAANKQRVMCISSMVVLFFGST